MLSQVTEMHSQEEHSEIINKSNKIYMFTTVMGLLAIGFFLYGFHKDGLFDKLQHKKLNELTVDDFGTLVLGTVLIIVFLKLFSDLF